MEARPTLKFSSEDQGCVAVSDSHRHGHTVCESAAHSSPPAPLDTAYHTSYMLQAATTLGAAGLVWGSLPAAYLPATSSCISKVPISTVTSAHTAGGS